MSIKTVLTHSVMPNEMFVCTAWPHEQCFICNDQLELCVSPLSQRKNAVQIHMAAMWNGQVLTFHDLNSKMKADTVNQYLQMLTERLKTIVTQYFVWGDDEDHEVIVSFGSLKQFEEGTSDPLATDMRLVLMVKDTLPINDEKERDMIHKSLRGEFCNWLEEVISDVPKEVSPEALKKDPSVILDVNLMSHEKQDLELESTLSIFALLFALFGIFLSDWFFFQVLAIILGGYVAFRSYKKQKYVCMALGIVACVVGCVFAALAFAELQESMKNVKIPEKYTTK